MVVIDNKEAWTDNPTEYKLYRINDTSEYKSYFSRCTLIEGETVESFEEIKITDIPKIEDLCYMQ